MWRAMAVIASLRDGKLAVAIPDSLKSRLASITNSDGDASVIVPRGRPRRSLNLQIPAGLSSAGVTITSMATSPLDPEYRRSKAKLVGKSQIFQAMILSLNNITIHKEQNFA
jgi:3-polyprenyl-4-hydroxybenzoate decarboxylase